MARWRPARPIARGAVGVGDDLVERGGEVGDVLVGVQRRAGAVGGLLDRDEAAGLAVDDDLGDAAGRGGDDRRLAGHRLEVDDAERLVDRRAGEHRRVGQQGDDVGPRQHLADPDDAGAGLAQLLDQAEHLGLDLGRVGGAGAEHELDVGRELRGRAQEERQPLLAGDPADEDDRRTVGVDAELAHPVGLVDAGPVVGVDAVVHDLDLVGVDVRVGPHHVVAHRRRHRDDARTRRGTRSSRPSARRRTRRRAARPSTAASAPASGRVITCGTPYSSDETCPAKLAYQVCECTRSVPSQPGDDGEVDAHRLAGRRSRPRARPGRRTPWCRPRRAACRTRAPGCRARGALGGPGRARRRAPPLRRRPRAGTPCSRRRRARC